jgi:hypothetical protein
VNVAIQAREVQVISSHRKTSPFAYFLAIVVGLGLAFQLGHFAEHGVQFAVWLWGKYEWVVTYFCGRDTPFMSAPVTELVRLTGGYLFPAADIKRQMMMGVEILHLVGNSIFLAAIAGVFYFTRSKWARYAFYIEAAHLCEHIALALSVYYLGKPLGLSTMFGQASLWWGQELAVGYRVAWHFVMNLLPMPFVIIALVQYWSARADGVRSERFATGATRTG